jgi:hypothetical protein
MLENRIEFLAECIKRQNDDTMLSILNEYNDAVGNNRIYLNNEDGIDELCCGMSYDSIFRAISYGDYKYTDTFVWFDDFGNIISSDDVPCSFCEVAEWMIENVGDGADDAWMIFNASGMVETGDIYNDLFDELDYRFKDVDTKLLTEWIEEESENVNISYWFKTSWNDLQDEYSMWFEQKETEYEKTLERCGLI